MNDKRIIKGVGIYTILYTLVRSQPRLSNKLNFKLAALEF